MNCSVCAKDDCWCTYCQKSFTSTGRLHRHIHTVHSYTIRASRCDELGDARMEC